MTTNKELLAELNTLREGANLPPVEFRGSRAQLEALIDQAKGGKFEVPVEQVSAAKPKRAAKKFEASKKELEAQKTRPSVQKAEPPATPHKIVREVPKGQFTVADLARELGIDPKVARAKCRRHADELPPTVAKHRFENKHRAKVKKLLQPA